MLCKNQASLLVACLGFFAMLLVIVMVWNDSWKENAATMRQNPRLSHKNLSANNGEMCTVCSTKTKECKDFRTENSESDISEWGPHKLAIIVPYRNAFEELLVFAPHVHHFIKERKVRHEIVVVHQVDNFR